MIPELSIEDCRRLIADGTITGGMISEGRDLHLRPGTGGRGGGHLDGKVSHAVLLELFTDYGAGTLIRRS